jgi:hypothetical protein
MVFLACSIAHDIGSVAGSDFLCTEASDCIVELHMLLIMRDVQYEGKYELQGVPCA